MNNHIKLKILVIGESGVGKSRFEEIATSIAFIYKGFHVFQLNAQILWRQIW